MSESNVAEEPETMTAIRLHAPGGLDQLVVERIRTPRLREGEVLVRVHAAAITRDELEWPTDRLPAIPSYEVSGVVVAVAPGVEEVGIGEPVYALTRFDRDGAAAEYVAVAANELSPKPNALDHVQSAAIPMTGLSAWRDSSIMATWRPVSAC
jgi:NADPH:quinone reductase-like Zn-dependent oxidoreductase